MFGRCTPGVFIFDNKPNRTQTGTQLKKESLENQDGIFISCISKGCVMVRKGKKNEHRIEGVF